MNDKTRLAKSWIFAHKLGVDKIGYEQHSWAVDEVIEMAIDKPNDLWDLILEILKIDDSNEIVAAVGAGPLEDLMVNHGPDFIEKIEEQAESSSAFKNAMKSTWLDSEDTTLYKKFYHIADIKPPFE